MIYFRDHRYGTILNSSFFLQDDKNLTPLDRLLVGDTFTLMWEVSEEVKNAMDNIIDPEFRVSCSAATETLYVFIPFTVVQRNHTASYRDSGTLQYLSINITLEAKTGHWEDLWKWLCLGDRPSWAGDE